MTDSDFLLEVLSDGQPHTLNEILQRSFAERGHGLTVHSRAADLRKQGHDVVNTHDPNGRRGTASVYSLRNAPASPRVGASRSEGTPSAPGTDGRMSSLQSPSHIRGRPSPESVAPDPPIPGQLTLEAA